MKPWQEEILESVQDIESEDALFLLLIRQAEKLGFEHCAYGLRLPLPLATPKIVMRNNYPAAWQARYQAAEYLAVDPTVRHGALSVLPLVWSGQVFASAPEFWEDARGYGLCYGWSQASIDPKGIRGMLTLARSGEPLSKPELAEKELRMVWLTQVAHVRMSYLQLSKLVPESRAELSPREIAVLRWTAEGKTSGEISDILGISERTVNFHIANAMAKMNCLNKTAAAVRAALLGFLA